MSLENPGYRVLGGTGPGSESPDTFAADVLDGLSRPRKRIPSKYFYDDEGSRLFARITELEEYYLTQAELSILRERGARLAELFGTPPYDLVELGAGDGQKTGVLLGSLPVAQMRYVPIDISEGAMRELVGRLRTRFATLAVEGLVSEYLTGLEALKKDNRRTIVCFLGSNIGNFPLEEATKFLSSIRLALQPGDGMLVGFDLQKDVRQMRAAYSDREGVTAAFNFNLLHRINRELGGHFEAEKFRHDAAYNLRQGAMESFLVSTASQKVRIDALDEEFEFGEGEAIHTEFSVKYTEAQIDALATRNGYVVVENLFDEHRYFCDSFWRVA